ncbi:hypothetical protein PG984_012670 [Apiospora sp. TS-2023a]
MLQDCNISRISIDVLGKYTMNQQVRAASLVGLSVDAYATCSVLIDTSEPVQRPTYFELSGNYKLIGPDVTAFLSRNKTSAASLWWGESLLYMYWLVTARADAISRGDTFTPHWDPNPGLAQLTFDPGQSLEQSGLGADPAYLSTNYTEGMELMGGRGRRSNSATAFVPLAPSPSGSPHQPLIK